MSSENNIILITNDENVSEILKPKLVLLREVDDILTTNYSRAMETIDSCLPEVVLIYCADEKDKCIELIKNIKLNLNVKDVSILLILDKYDQDFLLNAYDENITDYMLMGADDAEILIRTIWSLKSYANRVTLLKHKSLLENLDIINKDTGFYKEKYSENIFENEFASLKEHEAEGILMLVSPSEESKTKLNQQQLAKAIKVSTRTSDVIIHTTLNRFYILLVGTQLKGAFTVWEKIKRAVGNQYVLNGGISQVEQKNFPQLKKELLNAVVESKTMNQDLVIVSDEPKNSSTEWLDKINSAQKNFKLFKQAFNKKLEKVITPVFFQVQKLYEEKLFQIQIEQYSNSTLSAFTLKSLDKTSELKITYPGFSKINIDIIHEGLDSPENRRIGLDLTELDETRLTQILEDFIKEFKAGSDA